MDTQPQEVMQEFVEGLKEAYIERQLSCEEQWPPVSIEKLVNLQLVEAEKKEGFRAGLPQHGAHDDKVKRTPILHGDLFKVEKGKKPVRKLVVEGNAGIGKTTLCTMLTEKWANGETFKQFDCVLLLPLRDQLVSSASSLSDLLPLYHPDETVCGSVVQQLKRTRGKGVLIIADGWDELSEEKRSNKSFIFQLLFGRLLPSASVLLTSRPSASAPLHDLPTVDRLVEVVGFNEQNVKEYIESEFEKCPKKASSLIEQLENTPLIMSVCSVPLNCAIICNLWHTLNKILPGTLTELYTQIVLNIILRSHKKTFSETPLSLVSFDSIPKDLQEFFWICCKFAFECLAQNQVVFLKNELMSSFPEVLVSSDKLLCFGLVQSARSLLPVGQGLSFHFVHLTIQEFLAALHLVTLSNEEKLEVFKALAEYNQFAMVLRFVFGLGCQEKGTFSRKVVSLDNEVVEYFLRIIRTGELGDQTLLLCHCSLESMNGYVPSTIAKQVNGQLYTSRVATPHDCVAVFHVLRHTLHCPDMRINLSDCGLTDELLKELTDILFRASGELQVRELFLDSNKITDNGFIDLFNRASPSFSSLQLLELSSNRITNISQQFLSCNSLVYLHLSDNLLRVSGIQSLETAVQAGVCVQLRRLYLDNTLTDDVDINGALLATLSPSIAFHCYNLLKLTFSRNNLGVPGASALGGLFTRNRRELNLIVLNTNINAEAVDAFAISKPSCDCTLNLGNNPLGYDGLLAIFRMLRSEICPITSLSLDNTDLTSPVNTESQCSNIHLPNTSSMLNLGPMLDSSRLTELVISGNDFSGDNVFILSECICVCKSLEVLYCRKCSLTSSEVICILDHLKGYCSSHKNLRDWNLSDNSIDDKGVNALIESARTLLPNLEKVRLVDNTVSNEIQERLQKTLKVRNSGFKYSDFFHLNWVVCFSSL